MDAVIAGLGTALPQHSVDQSFAGTAAVAYCCEKADQARSVEALYRATGVNTRHSIVLKASEGSPEQRQDFFASRSADNPYGPSTGERMAFFASSAGPLAVQASSNAMTESGTTADQITHLITVTCSGFSAPGFDQHLFQHLPLRSTVERTQIGFMGCHAALNALRVARAFVRADPQAVVLICCVELCTLHYQYGWDPEQIVANSLFADGAAACVVRAGAFAAPTSASRFRILATGSMMLPDSRDAMTWGIGDHGFRMTLSASVPALLGAHLSPWLSEWLAVHGQSIEAIQTWAVHPGGPRILKAFCEAMRLDQDCVQVSREILRQFGNMSSPTLLFILKRLSESQAPVPCVAIGFGPGLAAEATLLG